MPQIIIEPASETNFKVIVRDEDGTESQHQLTVPPTYATKLGYDATDPESVQALVKASFEFLLAREPKDAILASFSLPQIEQYFPNYEAVIRA